MCSCSNFVVASGAAENFVASEILLTPFSTINCLYAASASYLLCVETEFALAARREPGAGASLRGERFVDHRPHKNRSSDGGLVGFVFTHLYARAPRMRRTRMAASRH